MNLHSRMASRNGYTDVQRTLILQKHCGLSTDKLEHSKERHDLCKSLVKTDRTKANIPKEAGLCEPSKLTNKQDENAKYKALQLDSGTNMGEKESFEEAHPRTKKINSRSRRRGSISQGIALASPKRSSLCAAQWSPSTAVFSSNQASIQESSLEWLDRHVWSEGQYDFPWDDARRHLVALRLGFFYSEQQYAVSKHIKLMCSLLLHMHRRKGTVDEIRPRQEYSAELVSTVTTFLAVAEKARVLFWGCPEGFIALLGIWKKSQQGSQQVGTTEAPEKDLASACAAALNVLTYTVPPIQRDHSIISETTWQNLIERLECQIRQGALSDAVQAVDHIYQWDYPLPESVKKSLAEMLPGIVPILWCTLQDNEATNETIIASSTHLLWRTYTFLSELRYNWLPEHKEALFFHVSKSTSIRIHEAALGMLQYWIANCADVRYFDDVQKIMCLCHSIRIHLGEPAIVCMGLNILQILLRVVSVGVLKPDMQNQIASITIQVVKKYDTACELVFATRIMISLLIGGILPLPYVLSFDFPRIAWLLHGLVNATEDQELRESCREALYLCLNVLTAKPKNGADLQIRDTISIFMKNLCEQITKEVTEEGMTFDLLVLSQLARTQPFSSEVTAIATKLLERIAAHHHNTGTNSSCFEIIASILSATANGELAASACRAMVGLHGAVDVDQLYYNRQHVANVLIYALRCNIGNEVASFAVIDTWHQLCLQKDYFKVEFVKHIPLLLQCMTMNLTDLKFQETACSILRMVASFGEAGRMARETETLTILADVLLAHCKSTLLVTEGLRLMMLLVREGTARLKLNGWSNVLLCLGRIHIQRAPVLSEIFAAVNVVALDFNRRTVSAPLEPALLELLCVAMRQFPNHACIQGHSCLVLHSHTYHVTSLEIIRQKTGTVAPLIVSAGRNFSDCTQRACHILSRLEYGHHS